MKRHFDLFPNATAPHPPNFNPAEEYQEGKSGWVKYLAPMNDSAIDFADFVYRSRLQALHGVDEIVNDVVAMLEAKGVLNNTYSKSTLQPLRKGYKSLTVCLQSSTPRTMATISASTVFREVNHSSTTKT